MQHVYEVYGNKINKAYVKRIIYSFSKRLHFKNIYIFCFFGRNKKKNKRYIYFWNVNLFENECIYIYIYKRLQRLKIWKMFYDNNLRITRSLNSFLSLWSLLSLWPFVTTRSFLTLCGEIKGNSNDSSFVGQDL